MVTLQDISTQLMKPAKDLADWKFPLSQILEEYYALLEEPCNINFGEAALVLQNSTNVYVRRIERLFSEAEILRQSFFVYQEEEGRSTQKETKASKKAYVDFENFIIIDLEKDIGKNIDKKNRFDTQKKVKLLSHRFTQLESNVAQLYIPIQIYDVLGEVIGKKYDFRCNQAINTDGMLVDELTPHDFISIHGSRVQKGRISLSSCSEPKTPGTGTSGYHSAASPNDNEFVSFNQDEFEEENNFSLETESVSNELTIIDKENTTDTTENTTEDCTVSSANPSISHESTAEKNSLTECTQNDSVENLENINDENSLTQNSKENSQLKKKCRNEHSEQKEQIEEDSRKIDETIEKFETNNCKQLNRISKEEQLRKGTQTAKTPVCSLDDINERDWRPMPLTQGTENVLPTNSSILRIPEYISRLEAKFGSKKRKLPSKRYKPECLTKLVLRESESFARKENNFVSQRKQKFKRLRKPELDDFMKKFDECLNETEKDIDILRCEAVTNISMDLLGFRISQNQNDFTQNNIAEISSSSPVSVELDSAIRHNSLDDTPRSPNIYNDWQEPDSENDLNYSLPDYQTLIEDKMKEIFKESDVTTELDQTVAQWHASLQQKLSETEIRSTFRIHDYASRIIKGLQALDQKKTNFDTIVQDQPPCEVARYFLASLQLANTYNIEIKGEESDESIQITLLENDGKDCEKN
ncbi:uncharacterized protein LOC143179264 [Calliopsis andreniformis]|uniref:uncharacterized protein LOC143179264 n=1 Tax=Calliopsis andreniformis TaxID=337506 RepID=UPI003FCDB531